MTDPLAPSRLAAWLARWGPIVPLLVAEFVLWVGFGALLPVMPIYFTDHGVDLALLGVIIAAWPAARLVGEPIFGWIADRWRRVPLMVVGLVVSGLAIGLSLVFVGPLEFLVLRAIAGLGTAIYDPSARGYLTDATPPARRGEAFGLYGAAQMGGLMLGPAIGGIGAAAFGSVSFVFVLGLVTCLLAALAVGLRIAESPHPRGHFGLPATPLSAFPSEGARIESEAAIDIADDEDATPDRDGAEGDAPNLPRSLWNRGLIAAIALNIGSYFAGGTYEVIWSLFLEDRGVGLDFVGLTFLAFGLTVLLLSPIAGRLVDRGGGFGFIVAGSVMMALASLAYPFLPVAVVIPVLVIEASGFAFLNPAMYAVVAASSPRGRSSTAQGVYGAAGTLGTIVSSLLAGWLASIDIRFPFWTGAVVMALSLAIGLTIGGRVMRAVRPAIRSRDPMAGGPSPA